MTLTKRDIGQAIHVIEPAISVTEAIQLIDTLVETVKAHVGRTEKVMITNFGTFEVVDRAPRRGVNPATGERMTIPAHRAVVFSPSPALQDALDG